ncbi:hypothetical protein [Anaeroselena agilis]|uniref:Transposase n=1 Tax=Anaeroselena agilis TaxID=3063788 RepID=A0ABU3NY05_9FIRM|nr:hypothetical protein [Selenomonadales bacterium 4137-cl]MDT8901865.1 hypothetical protein [Selenomonadales bacterium 4137-cl]
MFGTPITQRQVRSCRVWAADGEEAWRKIAAMLKDEGLTPVQPPRVRELAVELEGLIWWECQALCEG